MSHSEREVVITGLGPVTSIGVGCGALWDSLLEGRTQASMRPLQIDVARVEPLPVAAMPPFESIPGIARHVDYLAEQEAPGHRDLALSMLAMELAVDDAGLSFDRGNNTVGMVQAFEAPGVEQTVGRLFGMMSTPPPDMNGPPRVYDALAPSFYGMQAFVYVHLAAKAFGLHGFCTSVHNACSSAAYAIEVAAGQIRSGAADAMVVAGGEAFDTAVRLEWFRRLELYADDPTMRPFDSEASGFFVGEGAAALVLEAADHAARRGANVYARYAGGAWEHQGWKQTLPDVRAGRLRRVVERAIETSGASASEIDLVVPHGAATGLSDRYEAECIGQALNGKADRAIATALKPYFGHMLAASGIIETCSALLAMKHGVVPATLHTRKDKARFPIPLAHESAEKQVGTLLKVFTGFTGHDAALVFSNR